MRSGDGAANRQTCDETFQVREFKEPNWIFNRDMYVAVGETWKWIDKLPWTDEQWNQYASDPKLRSNRRIESDRRQRRFASLAPSAHAGR